MGDPTFIDLTSYDVTEEEYREIEPAFLWFVKEFKGVMGKAAKEDAGELDIRLGGLAIIMALEYMLEKTKETIAEVALHNCKVDDETSDYN